MVYDGVARLLGIALAVVIGIIVDRITDRNKKFPKLVLLVLGGFFLNEISSYQFGNKFIEDSDIEFAAMLVELTLSLVLFKEGLELDLKSFKEHLKPIIIMATIGLSLNTLISGLLLVILTPLAFFLAVLISGLLAPTDPAATFSLFKGDLRIKPKEKSIIGGESALNDAVAIVLVTTVFVRQAVKNSLVLDISVFLSILSSFFGGLILGYLLGRLFLRINSKMTHYSQTNYISLGLVLLTFTLSAYLHSIHIEVSAAITALTAGTVFGNPHFFNTERFPQHHLHEFQGNFSELAELLAFVTIGMLITPNDLGISIIFGIVFGLLAILGRTITMIILSRPSGLNIKESIFISIGGMRGLATGVLAVIILPELKSVFSSTFTQHIFVNSIVIGLIVTSLVQGLSVKYIGGKTSSLLIADIGKELRLNRRLLTSELSFMKRKLDDGLISKDRYRHLSLPLQDKLAKIKEEIESVRNEKMHIFEEVLFQFEMNTYVLHELIEYRDKVLLPNDRDDISVKEKIKELEKKEEELMNVLLLEIDITKRRLNYVLETEDKEFVRVTSLAKLFGEKIQMLKDTYPTLACEKLWERMETLKIGQLLEPNIIVE